MSETTTWDNADVDAEPTLRDVIAELRAMRGADKARARPPVIMDSPVWSVRHIAVLLDCSEKQATGRVVRAKDFPAPRAPQIASGDMRNRWYRDDVLAWFDRQPVVVSRSA